MLLALKIIGVALLIVLLAVALFIYGFIRKLRHLAAAAASMSIPSGPPCRISLKPEPDPQWRSPSIVERFAGEFRALGFEDAGAFSMPEMDGTLILGFVHRMERLTGVIYDHKQIDPTFDIVCEFEDGTGLSATNTDLGSTLDKRPGHTTLWLGPRPVAEVLDAVQKQPQSAARIPVTPEEFAPRFRKSYAESMNWRMKKGGTSREEIRRQADDKGQTLSEEELETCYQSLRMGYLRQLDEGCTAQFLEDRQTAPPDWDNVCHRVVVISETMERQEIVNAIEGVMELNEAQEQQLKKLDGTGKNGVQIMQSILDGNGSALGVRILGEVKEPVPALILLAPEPEEPEDEA